MGILLLGAPSSQFNLGRSQVNLNFINGTTGEYPFLDLMKTAADWSFNNNANAPVTPDLLDANGWPSVFTGTNPSSGYSAVFFAPSQAARPGNYVATWQGNGTIALNMASAFISGSLTSTTGSGRYVFSTTATTFDVRITVGPLTSLRVFHVDDEAALTAGQVFGAKFLARLREANFGVIRFLNWIPANSSNLTTWATKKAASYWSYGSTDKPLAIYGGATTNSGSDYSCATPSGGFSVSDKQMLSFTFNTSCPTEKAATFVNGQSNVTVTAHGQVTGNQAYLQTNGTLPTNFSPNINYTITVIDANTLNYSNGGAALVAGSAGSGSHTSFPVPRIKVGSGVFTQLLNQYSVPYPQSFVAYPVGGTYQSFATGVYDATLGGFVMVGGTLGSSGIANGAPPETCLALCAAVGAHPWISIPPLACDPATDFLPSLASYIKSNYAWMIPRFEPPNELWNPFGTLDTAYAKAKAAQYGWGTDYNNWYGKALSILGQQAAATYGIGNLGTSYHMVCGVQTITDAPSSNARLSAALFVGGSSPLQAPYTRSAASGWTSHVAIANYFSPLERYTCQDLVDGYAYTVTNAANPTAQATIANGYVDTLVSQSAAVTVASGVQNITYPSAHGRSVNDQVVPTAGVGSTGLTLGQFYYVKQVISPTVLTLASTLGGVVITPSGSGSPTLAFAGSFNLALVYGYATAWKAWGAGFGVSGLCCYEGGYSPDYMHDGGGFPTNAAWSTAITGATRATSCVLTLASTTDNSEIGGLAGNPAVVGMQITPTGVVGMTQLNGNTYTITAVSGNQITINVDSSAFGIYASGGTMIYLSSTTYSNTLRGAGKLAANLQGYLTTNYNNIAAAGNVFPSCFQFGGPPPPGSPTTNVWSVLEDVYQAVNPPQWNAIVAFNH